MSSDAVPALYERHAHAFDTARGRSLTERGSLIGSPRCCRPGGRVHGFRLTSVDKASSLLALYRAWFPAQEWCQDLGRRFDGILAWDSLFHLNRADQRTKDPECTGHTIWLTRAEQVYAASAG